MIIWGHSPFPFFITSVKQFTERQLKLKQRTKDTVSAFREFTFCLREGRLLSSMINHLMRALKKPKGLAFMSSVTPCLEMVYFISFFFSKHPALMHKLLFWHYHYKVTLHCTNSSLGFFPVPSALHSHLGRKNPSDWWRGWYFNQAVMDAAEVKGLELLINRVWKPFNAIIHIHASLTSATLRSSMDLLQGNKMYIYSCSLSYLICPAEWMRSWWHCRLASRLNAER